VLAHESPLGRYSTPPPAGVRRAGAGVFNLFGLLAVYLLQRLQGVLPLSPASALYQVSRVARVRKLDESAVRQLVEQHIEGRQLGVLGEPRVSVLTLNLALDGR
jgi:hypothetical protein